MFQDVTAKLVRSDILRKVPKKIYFVLSSRRNQKSREEEKNLAHVARLT